MTIKFCSSLKIAHDVLKLVNRTLKIRKDIHLSMWAESFDNCREQGLCLVSFQGRIAITQHKNSDSIVVYTYTENNHPSNLPKGDYWNGMFFKYDETDKAAEFIVEQIKALADSLANEVSESLS